MSGDDTRASGNGDRQNGALTEIANVMVRLHKDMFGRGPTKARASWAGDDVLIVVLEDTLTPAEHNLVRMGEHQRLRDTRLFFQHAAVRDFCTPIEELTGRRVRAFMSALDTEADGMATEIFVMHPPGYDGPSRIERAEV